MDHIKFSTGLALVFLIGITFLDSAAASKEKKDLCDSSQSATVLKFFKCEEKTGTTTSSPESDNEDLSQYMPPEALVNQEYASGEQNAEIYEGDILNISPEALGKGQGQLKDATADENARWPNGRVAYILDKRYRPREKRLIRRAMDTFEKVSCVRFEKKTAEDTDYIYISPGLGCNSYVGKMGEKQVVSFQLGACFSIGIIQHELMHTLGFRHEQSRPDRDRYVRINWRNIREGDKTQFARATDDDADTLGLPYDYGSIMHYGVRYFAVDKRSWSIKPKRRNVQIGQREKLSELDVQKLNLLYKCSKAPELPACEDGWVSVGEVCYYLSFQNAVQAKSWTEAEAYCQSRAAHLTSVTASSTSVIAEAVGATEQRKAWIGAKRPRETRVELLNGTIVEFPDGANPWDASAWHNCIAIDSQGRWRDEVCGTNLPFSCAKPARYANIDDDSPSFFPV